MDSGSQVSTISIDLLTLEQRNRIRSSPIRLCAYGNQPVQNLGRISLNLVFENGVELESQDLLVVNQGILPVIGTNVLFPENGESLFSIDKTRMKATLHGQEIDVVTEVEVESSSQLIHSIGIEESAKDQIMTSTMDMTIPGRSEMVFEAQIELPPSSTHFMVENGAVVQFSEGISYLLPMGRGLYCQNQFDSFPVRVVNPYDCELTIPKGSKLGRISPMSGEIDTPVMTNSLEAEIDHNPVDRVEAIWNEINKGSLAAENEAELKKIIFKYKDIILLNGELPSRANVEMFRVYPKSKNPVASNFYRTPYPLRATMRKILEDNCKKGILKRTSSPYNSPTLLVKKPCGSFRLVVDYRRINEQIESDCYPLPNIKDLVNQLKNSRVFSTLDLVSGYNQVPVHPDSKQLLAIGNETGQYSPEGMPMGIKTAPGHFQRCMDELFRKVPLSVLLVYLDDVMIHSRCQKSHLVQLEKTLGLLHSKNLQCKATKLTLLTDKVEFCGHMIHNGQIMVSEKRIEALQRLKTPTNARQSQSLFGFLNYLREMVSYFSEKAQPISKTYSGRFKWTADAQKAFENLRDEIGKETLRLEIPDCNEDCFVLETDSSNKAMGACLFVCTKRPAGVKTVDFHDHGPECLRPVAFWSQNFTESQAEKYYIREKELTSGRNAMNHFRMYLTGKQFIWRTDNRCLAYAKEMRANKDSVNRKLCEIQAYDFVVQPRQSSQMKVSDCLTRSTVLNQLKLSRVDVSKLQKDDPVLMQVSRFVQTNLWPHSLNSDELVYWRKRRQQLGFGNSGELRLSDQSSSMHQILLPSALKNEMLVQYHDSSGHPGADNTLKTLSRHFTWYGIREEVEKYVRSCEECQADKPNLHPRTPPPKITDTPQAPFLKMSCDLTGPLPTTNRNSRYVFVANDLFSKKIYARPLPDKKSSTTLEALKSIVYSNPRLPREILTDNGLEFEGMFTSWLEENGIKHIHTSPYHPQSNGVTERSNATLKQRLKAFRNGNWEERLREMVHQINLTPSESTRLSPFAVETGFDGVNPKCPVDVKDTVRAETISELQKLVRDRLTKEKESRSSKKSRHFVPFSKGDRVLLKAKTGSIRYVGPFEIIDVFSDGYAYQLKSLEDGSEYRRRVELLKPYVEREQESTKPDQIEEESPEDTFTFGSFGLEDFDIHLAPNSGRMWPTCAPPPVSVALSSPHDTPVTAPVPSSPSVVSPEMSSSSIEIPELPSVQAEVSPSSISVPDLVESASVQEHITSSSVSRNELNSTLGSVAVSEVSSTHGGEEPQVSFNIEDVSVKEEVVIGTDSQTSVSSDETVIAGHPEPDKSNCEMISQSNSSPSNQDTVAMETSEHIPTVNQADDAMQTMREEALPDNDVSMSDANSRMPRKRRHDVETEKNVERRISKRLKTKNVEFSIREDCSDSFIATEQTFAGGSQVPFDALRTMLKTKAEILDLCLADVDQYQLDLIIKQYGVPDQFKTIQEVSDYLREVAPLEMSLKNLKSDWWPVVPVEFMFDPKHSIPEQSESNGGYCISTMGYHGLLGLLIQFRIPVWQFQIHSATSIRKRINDFVVGSDSELFIINDGDGLAYLCFE